MTVSSQSTCLINFEDDIVVFMFVSKSVVHYLFLVAFFARFAHYQEETQTTSGKTSCHGNLFVVVTMGDVCGFLLPIMSSCKIPVFKITTIDDRPIYRKHFEQ